MFEIDVGRTIGACTGGDDDIFASHRGARTVGLNGFDRIWIEEGRLPANNGDVVTVIKRRSHFDLSVDHRSGSPSQFRQHEVGGDSMFAEQDVVVDLGHLKDGEPQCLAGDRATMSAISADGGLTLDHGNAFSVLDGLHRGPLTAGAGSNHDHIVLLNRFGHEFPFL